MWWVFFPSSLYPWSFIRMAAGRGASSEALWSKTALPFHKRGMVPSLQASSWWAPSEAFQVSFCQSHQHATSLLGPYPRRGGMPVGKGCTGSETTSLHVQQGATWPPSLDALPEAATWHWERRSGSLTLTWGAYSDERCLWVSLSSKVLLRLGKHLPMGKWEIGKKVICKLPQPGSETPYSHYWRG